MRIRGLMIAVAVLALLGGLLWWSNKAEKAKEGQPARTRRRRSFRSPRSDPADRDARKDGEATVIRKNASNKWEMTAPQPLSVIRRRPTRSRRARVDEFRPADRRESRRSDAVRPGRARHRRHRHQEGRQDREASAGR